MQEMFVRIDEWILIWMNKLVPGIPRPSRHARAARLRAPPRWDTWRYFCLQHVCASTRPLLSDVKTDSFEKQRNSILNSTDIRSQHKTLQSRWHVSPRHPLSWLLLPISFSYPWCRDIISKFLPLSVCLSRIQLLHLMISRYGLLKNSLAHIFFLFIVLTFSLFRSPLSVFLSRFLSPFLSFLLSRLSFFALLFSLSSLSSSTKRVYCGAHLFVRASMSHDSLTLVTWLTDMCDMTPRKARPDSLMCATWHIDATGMQLYPSVC